MSGTDLPNGDAAINTGSTAAASPTPAVSASEGYKVVKIRRADGTIASVRQKIKQTDDTASNAVVPNAVKTDLNKSAPSNGQQAYKIVTIKKPDGTVTKVRRPIPAESQAPASESPNEMTQKPETTQPATAPPLDTTDPSTKTTTTLPSASTVPLPTIHPAEAEKSAAATIDGPSPASPVAPTSPSSEPEKSGLSQSQMAAALQQQRSDQQARSGHKFKAALSRGLGTIASSALGSHMEFSHDFEDGDEVISDDDEDDDYDIDDDDDDDEEDQDGHNAGGNDNEKSGGTDGHQTGNLDGTHFTINGAPALQSATSALAASAAGQPPPRQTAAPANGAVAGKNNEGSGVRFTAKELKDIEEADERKAATQPLAAHWSNFTFYLMASLSIALPLFLLVVGVLVAVMNNKPTASHWKVMENLLKVTISAWPIIFAAVVAQVFKAWATYKVERGIKLMELEQLVGSNSFGSAIKQPFVLRRLNLLTLALFLVWCLSPLGSSALQRVYVKTMATQDGSMSVKYLNTQNFNQAFSDLNDPIPAGFDYDKIVYDQRFQEMALFYSGSFMPSTSFGDDSKMFQDQWNHPRVQWLNQSRVPYQVSAYGLPVIMERSKFGPIGEIDQQAQVTDSKKAAEFEVVSFNVSTAYFDVSCGSFSTIKGQDIANQITDAVNGTKDKAAFENTPSYTLLMALDKLNNSTTINSIRLASQNKQYNSEEDQSEANQSGTAVLNTTADFSYLECSFKQVFINAGVECTRQASSKLGMPDCGLTGFEEVPASQIKNPTTLLDWWGPLAFRAYPIATTTTTTSTEFFLRYGVDGEKYAVYDSSDNFTLSDAPAWEVENRLAYIANTWIGLGYCAHCNGYVNFTEIDPMEEGLFNTANATWTYTNEEVYKVVWVWVGLYMACGVLLLVAGIGGVIIESQSVAPDVLGYVSTVARNSKHLHLKKTSSAMTGPERARMLGQTKVMMQDVQPGKEVGRIALGMKHEKAEKLKPGRLYR